MSRAKETEAEQYFYRSSISSSRHRNRVSAYFVERLQGSNIVARIEPLGLVPTSLRDEQLAIQRLRRNLVADGLWQETSSGHHQRQRVVPAEVVTTKKVAPQSS
jgi:hypothetical protein